MYKKYLKVEDLISIFRMKSLPKGSKSWNFMVKCRNLVGKYLMWDVGKGNETLFWEDSWDGHPPIDSSPFPGGLKEKLINLWGSRVCDYKIKVSSDEFSGWIWKPLKEIDLDPAAIKAYEEIIQRRKVKQLERRDKLIWAASNDKRYNVKNGYEAFINSK